MYIMVSSKNKKFLFKSFKLGYHRGDKPHRSSSSPEMNVAGTIKVSSSNLHRQRWVDIHRPGSSLRHESFL